MWSSSIDWHKFIRSAAFGVICGVVGAAVLYAITNSDLFGDLRIAYQTYTLTFFIILIVVTLIEEGARFIGRLKTGAPYVYVRTIYESAFWGGVIAVVIIGSLFLAFGPGAP